MTEATGSDINAIQVLPPAVQNKIAAGEVVERPASVVKELVENSLDAGARHIEVALEEGGHRLLRITDDGCGMSEQDLMLALQRHATSKIRDVDDIFHIQTMGFRGEALPAIGSVSRLTVATCLRDADVGSALKHEGGITQRVQPAPPRPGTCVTVEDLFFNTPARRKFMKSASAEVAAISEVITRLALARADVGFRLVNNGRITLEVPPQSSRAERIGSLFGRDVASRLVAVFRESQQGFSVQGFAARPPESRANSRQIYVFLNQRWIRHPGIARVIRDAYRGMLPPRRYPFAVLYLDLDTEQVDVNVHPTKEEVRFENERQIVGTVRRAVAEALAEPEDAAAGAGEPGTTGPGERKPPQDASAAEAVRESVPARPSKAAALCPSGSTPEEGPSSPGPGSVTSRDGLASARASSAEAGQSASEASPPQQASLPGQSPPQHRVLAQAGRRYLVVESPEGIKLVDQHALHERWNFERLRDRQKPVVSQQLLLPVVVELSPEEAARLDEVLPLLREFGFGIERFGLSTLSVSAVPEIVKPSKVEQVVRDVFADVDKGGAGALRALREELLASLACHSAVLFGTHLPHDALVAIMDKFHEAKEPLTCPHGRPTTVTITWEELERRFGRA